MEDEIILPESFYYKIIYSKRHVCLNNLCESYTDSMTTINIHRLAAY